MISSEEKAAIKSTEAFRDYQRAIQPYVKMKVDIYSITMPVMIIHRDGTMERQWKFTPEQLEIIERADEVIEHIKQSFGKNPIELLGGGS